jgi:hypothetical protein
MKKYKPSNTLREMKYRYGIYLLSLNQFLTIKTLESFHIEKYNLVLSHFLDTSRLTFFGGVLAVVLSHLKFELLYELHAAHVVYSFGASAAHAHTLILNSQVTHYTAANDTGEYSSVCRKVCFLYPIF